MTKPLISEGLTASLWEQWGHERTNAHIYLYMAGFLKNKGFENLSSHFEKQHNEEIEHSDEIYHLLTDLNSTFKSSEIPEINYQFNSILDIATLYLQRETETTASLDSIKLKSVEESNPVVEERIRELILLQQHEYSEATDFSDKAELAGEDWFKVMLWDVSIKG